MAAIELMQSPRLTLVNCQISSEIVKAGWAYTYGGLASVETMAYEGGTVNIQIPPFMQTNQVGGEMFEPNDTIDFRTDE